MFFSFELSRRRIKVKLFHCYYYYNQYVDRFNNGFRSLDVYMYMQFYYKYVILMMCFNTVFGDTPSSVYGIYVVLYVTYG